MTDLESIYTPRYDNDTLKRELEHIREYYMEYMIGQSLWMLKAEILEKKENGEPYSEGEYSIWDSDGRSPTGFSGWQELDYACIDAARHDCPVLLAQSRFFTRTEYRPRPVRQHVVLFLKRTVVHCTLAAGLTPEGKRYLECLQRAAEAEGIALRMRYYWKYCYGEEGHCCQTEPLDVPRGPDPTCDFAAPVDIPLHKMRDGATLVVQLYYKVNE